MWTRITPNTDTFYVAQSNQSPGYGEINSNIIKMVFEEIYNSLKSIFENFLTKRIFPDGLEFLHVTPLFKSGKKTDISNYRPTSDLPYFSKILKRIMYNNRLFIYLIENDILYDK